MHFLFVGPGALGCLLYAKFSQGLDTAKSRVSILDYNSSRAEKITQTGITYHLGDEKHIFHAVASSAPESMAHPDVIIFCVKSYDVLSSLNFCKPLLQKNTLLLFMQNGISHLNLTSHIGDATIAYGTTTEGATLLATGQVRHAGSGVSFLGFLEPVDQYFTTLLETTCNYFSSGGLQISTTDDILPKLWAKLFVNVGINALTAILRCKNGELLTIPGITSRMEEAIDEALLVAQTKGIEIFDDPITTTRIVAEKTAQNISSMLQDVKNGRKTEIDAINGAIVNEGILLGIPTPANSRLTQQVKDIESTF